MTLKEIAFLSHRTAYNSTENSTISRNTRIGNILLTFRSLKDHNISLSTKIIVHYGCHTQYCIHKCLCTCRRMRLLWYFSVRNTNNTYSILNAYTHQQAHREIYKKFTYIYTYIYIYIYINKRHSEFENTAKCER